MSGFSGYNPVPPRAWSRVQNRCPYADNNSSNLVFLTVPLTSQNPVTLAQAAYEAELLQKGNILQYKGNSSRLTKKQKYTQLAKGFGPNRTKVFATQSQTYTNPNTTGLARVNSVEIQFPNTIVGKPNNISGPFQYAVPNPNGCTGVSLQDGGNLVCGTYANPCSGEIIKNGNTSATICNPASASDVPGSSILCWNETVQTWFPRQRYIMTNSSNKWPQGYKGFVSAVKPAPPTISIYAFTPGVIQLLIIPNSNNCYPTSNFNIYIDGIPFDNIQNISKDGFLYTIIYDINTLNINQDTTYSGTREYSVAQDTTYSGTREYSVAQDTTVNNLLLPKLFETNKLMTSMQTILETSLPYENNTQNDLQTTRIITQHINKLNTNQLLKRGLPTVDTKINSFPGVYSKYTVSNTKFTIIVNSVIKTRNTTDESGQIKQNIIHFDHVNYNDSNGSGGSGGNVSDNNLLCDCTTFNQLFTSNEFTYINEQMSALINTKDSASTYKINIDDFDTFNFKLYNIKKLIDPSCCFYNIIDLYMNIWRLVYFSFNTKNNFYSNIVNSEQWKQDSIILHDMELLKKYLSQMTLSLPDVTVRTNLALIKPQYVIYHNLYGIPEQFEYDVEKMSNIMTDLNINS